MACHYALVLELSMDLNTLGEEKKNMFSVRPLWKKEKRRRFFFFPFKMAAGHIFQNNRPAYFFKMAASFLF